VLDLTLIPGTEYAVLRRVRENVLAVATPHRNALPPVSVITREPWPDLPPAQDPWQRPAWDADTVYMAALSTLIK
jgi:hypothetical protein